MFLRIWFMLILLSFAGGALGDTATFKNSDTPRDGVKQRQLKELWRAGGEDDDVFFGLVAKVETDSKGNTYVLDSQTCQVYMYSPEGELLRTLFREGEGPGEIRQARDMVIMGDGRIGVIQEIPGAISFVQPDGTPAGRTYFVGPEGGTTNLTGCSATGDVLLVSGTYNRPGSNPNVMAREMTLERFNATGEFMTRYEATTAHYDFGDFQFNEIKHLPPFWFTFAVTDEGKVFSANKHQDYAINVKNSAGEKQMTITRPYEPLRRTQQEKRRIELMILSAFSAAPIQPTIHISENEPAISYFHRAVQIHDDGNLWVLSGRGLRPDKPEAMASFDVFTQEGEFIRQEVLLAPHDARTVGIFLSGPDRILVVNGYMDSLAAQFGNGTAQADEGYEPQAPEVICYSWE